ncbi:hypothetical protein KIL84_013820 [Mauremys mutica]|uniref:Uncharacterized protein n=1 Tax=Mauremys mutica TaxID=74926 RepID=A0A9D4AUQ3_9SAUR|nr:hypothetical protein KIL84_013820 [Mauremys mutica]
MAKEELVEDSDIECAGITWDEVPQLASACNQWRSWTAICVSSTGGTKVGKEGVDYHCSGQPRSSQSEQPEYNQGSSLLCPRIDLFKQKEEVEQKSEELKAIQLANGW